MVRDHLDFTLGQRNGTSDSPKWRNCFTTKSSNRQMDGNHNMSDRLLPTTKCPLQEFLFLMLIIWESSFILWQSLKSSLFFLSFFQIVESLNLPNRKSDHSVRREWLYQGQHFLLWWQQAACGTSADGSDVFREATLLPQLVPRLDPDLEKVGHLWISMYQSF